MLIQETPTFQVVDEPELPLKKNRTGYLISIIYGGLIAGIAGAMYLLLSRKKAENSWELRPDCYRVENWELEINAQDFDYAI